MKCSNVLLQDVKGRLILDYSGINQGDTVAWIWIKKGFSLKQARTLKVYPLENYSRCTCPEFDKKLSEEIRDIFKTVGAGHADRMLDLGVKAAVVEMKPERSIVDRFSNSLSSYPRIEMEVVIFDEKTGTVLLKLRHYRREKTFKAAVKGMVSDLKLFFTDRV